MSLNDVPEKQDNDKGCEELIFKIFSCLERNPGMRNQFFAVLKQYMEAHPVNGRFCIKQCKDKSDDSVEQSPYSSLFFKFWRKQPRDLRVQCHNDLLHLLNSIKCCPKKLTFPLSSDAVKCDRYRSDYIETGFLGEGGYGIVAKALHKLDGREYAIKRVPLSLLPTDYESLIREVKVLSKLQHHNVAHYFTSWIQMEDDVGSISSSSESINYRVVSSCSSCSSSSSVVFRDSTKDLLVENNAPDSEFTESSNLSLNNDHSSQSCCTEVDESNFNDVVVLNNQSEKQSLKDSKIVRYKIQICNTSNVQGTSSNNSDWNIVPSSQFARQRVLKVPTLFIQMELGSESLKEWIKRRNDNYYDKQFSWTNKELQNHFRMFKEILLALNYIHSNDVVHRDIKPANILLAEDSRIILADFGLAKLFMDKDYSKRSFSCVGTPAYCAPEINTKIYDSKVDVYSLGIILLELLQPFSSGTERAKVIETLKRKRQLDRVLTMGKWEYFSRLVLKMTEKDSKLRPSAAEILNDIEGLRKSRIVTRSFSAPGIIETEFHVIGRKEDLPQPKKPLKRTRTFSNTISSSNKYSADVIRNRKLIKKYVTLVISQMSKKKAIEIQRLKNRIRSLESRIEELERS